MYSLAYHAQNESTQQMFWAEFSRKLNFGKNPVDCSWRLNPKILIAKLLNGRYEGSVAAFGVMDFKLGIIILRGAVEIFQAESILQINLYIGIVGMLTE